MKKILFAIIVLIIILIGYNTYQSQLYLNKDIKSSDLTLEQSSEEDCAVINHNKNTHTFTPSLIIIFLSSATLKRSDSIWKPPLKS